MKIIVDKNELVFQKNDSQGWFSKISFLKYDLHFSFQESIFVSSESGKIEIDWKLIEEFLKHFFKNIEFIDSKGGKIIEELQKIVHADNHLSIQEKGEFEIDEISLIDFQKTINNFENGNQYIQYHFKYDIGFFFSTESGYNEEPRYFYTVQFCNHHSLSITGVYNNIWSLYK